jgi:hypothetical protein
LICPAKENRSDCVAAGTITEYFPSGPVDVPIVVPGATTVTPASGIPSEELFTVPEIWIVCDMTKEPVKSIRNKNSLILFMKLISLG